jgi:hypothetical protein
MLDGRFWGADLSSVVSLVESLVSGGNGSRFCANAHLNDNEAVAKMGHPKSRCGPPAPSEFCRGFRPGTRPLQVILFSSRIARI